MTRIRMPATPSAIGRRTFLKLASATTAVTAAPSLFAANSGQVILVIDGSDPIASGPPVQWAATRLRDVLRSKGERCDLVQSRQPRKAFALCIVVAGPASPQSQGFLGPQTSFTNPEALRLVPGRLSEGPAILVSAVGTRGYVYGLLELAERVQFSTNPATALHLPGVLEEHPANPVRSVARSFCSELEDKPWFYDQDFWRGYLDLLATSRFNRFTLNLGIGYDFPRGVTGDYLHFPYPYLVDVPGIPVRVVRLGREGGQTDLAPFSAEERQKNLRTLQFIAAETAARGLDFQLGLWTHAYAWTDSPHAHHRIDGLDPQNHAAYCRDALAMLLHQCPQIQGLTLRVHGESGVPEGSYPFWKTLFQAISGCGRTVEIDMHAKGVNQIMIDMAAETGMPFKLGAKYSAEHQSLGYQQADIRELEIPSANRQETGVFNVSNGERRFTRYGYADFLARGSRYQLLFRLWPGTQRHLLSADPAMAAAYSRSASFCGAAGLEIMEPLTFKGREGSGLPGGRCAYRDRALTPAEGDWKKYEYFYRMWGRCLYHPDVDPECWRRYLQTEFGNGAAPVEAALANASRALPLVTSAHLASASNHALWFEIYDNMPVVLGGEPSPYSDTPTPKCCATVSPLDPQLFSTIAEFTQDLLQKRSSAKYSPLEVAQWLEAMAVAAKASLMEARAKATATNSPSFRRIEEDVLIQIGLASFFAAKLRCCVLFELYQQTGDAKAGKLALAEYRQARETWSAMAARASMVYGPDITYGEIPMRRGSWAARLPGIDIDIAAMESKLQSAPSTGLPIGSALEQATGVPRRLSLPFAHTAPAGFEPAKPLAVSLRLAGKAPAMSVQLLYRHVNQGERWRTLTMEQTSDGWSAVVPAEYTQSPYPMQYYFVVRQSSDAWLFPGFHASLSNQPYYAVTQLPG